jgi:nucleoside-diphosphate-sugar epimerase
VKKALITGGAGFIGLSLARRLLEEDVAVDLVDNFSRGPRDAALTAVAESPHVRCLTLDLSIPGATSALDRDYDAIYHLAAIVGVVNVVGRAYDTLKLNVELTTEALRLAKCQTDLKVFLFVSTSEVYAGTLLAGLLAFPTPENSTIALPALEAPRTSYMLSKLYGEALVHHAGVPIVIIRPHNVYGPRMGTEHVVPELMKRMREAAPGSRLPIYSPTHSRTFCFIDDAVELTARLARNPEAAGQAWNVGTEAPEYQILQVAEIVRQVVGADVELAPANDTAGSPTRRCPSMAKTNTVTGHHARVSFEEGVDRTYAWYSRHVFG